MISKLQNNCLKLNIFLLILFFGSFGLAKSSWAATYYISADGSDANNGTTKNTSWLHAPGMVGCSNVCASTTPHSGDSFILKGGDTWHHDILPWNWEWDGAPSGIYIGVDPTWYTGASWKRPIINGDNPTSNTAVERCTYNYGSTRIIFVASIHTAVENVHLDNFEVTGVCWDTPPTWGAAAAVHIGSAGNHNDISNFYVHGWTHSANCGCYQGGNPPCYCDTTTGFVDQSNLSEVYDNVVDGWDTDRESGVAFYGGCYNNHHNVIRYVANGIVGGGCYTVHDNLLEYIPESFDGNAHTNTYEGLSANASDIYFYNNLMRHNTNAQHINIVLPSGYQAYIFNNVSYDFLQSYGVNYAIWEGGENTAAHIWNNTFQFSDRNWFRDFSKGTLDYKNNHIISDGITEISSLSQNEVSPPGTTTDANSLYQTNAIAAGSSQGYTSSNEYAPSVQTASTINAGQNLGSNCTGQLSALCYGFVPISYDAVNHKVIHPATAPGRGSTWDIGAYEDSSGGDTTPPASPTGLTVQ